MVKGGKKDLGGWLLLYTYMVSLHTTLYFFATVMFLALDPAYFITSIWFVLYGTTLTVFVLALSMIFIRSKKAIVWNIAAMTLGVVVTATSYVLKDQLPSSLNMMLPSYCLSTFIVSTLVSLAWIVYWDTSRRVRNTFGH